MRIRLKTNVYQEAQKRVSFLFDNFDTIFVGFSGGKDSTVCLNLALEEAAKRDRLPLKVLFIDQEAEWQATIDYVKTIMNDPRVEPVWLQCPIKISNSASGEDLWLQCWEKGGEWMRPKEPNSIHDNNFGTDRFHAMFEHVLAHYYPDQKACLIGGVRAEESPARRQGLTTRPKYKHVTWGKRFKKAGDHPHWAFYPIYDWTYRDIWKCIHDNGYEYCNIYNLMYQHGVSPFSMRVSNLHHETAVTSLYYMQEIEQDTWDKMTARLGGVHATRNLEHKHMFKCPKKLPFMFKTWIEYRDHLLDTLIDNEEHKELYRKTFARYDDNFDGMLNPKRLWTCEIVTLLANDFHLTKLDNFASTPQAGEFIKYKSGRPIKAKFGQWIKPEDLEKAPKQHAN